MHRRDVDLLDPARPYWVAAVIAPERDWRGAPGCHKGARFLVERRSLKASRTNFTTFDCRPSCLRWIMEHRFELNRALPDAAVTAVRLDQWLLGLDQLGRQRS